MCEYAHVLDKYTEPCDFCIVLSCNESVICLQKNSLFVQYDAGKTYISNMIM